MTISRLMKLIQTIDLSFCDDFQQDIRNSSVYQEFELRFPLLGSYFQEINVKREFEFQRTIRHVFRMLIIYTRIKNQKEFPSDLSPESISRVRNLILEVDRWNPNVLPLVLLYHDIGRVVNRQDHTREGARQLERRKLLAPHALDREIESLIIQLVKYHLLFGTTFTGESSHYAAWPLFLDGKFLELIDKGLGPRFFEVFTVFAILDVLGYPYSRIYDHYIAHYLELKEDFTSALSFFPDTPKIKGFLKERSAAHLEWRLGMALRMFQYLNSTPKHTQEFFRSMFMNGLAEFLQEPVDLERWKRFLKDQSEAYRAQLLYGLPNLMILATSKFARKPAKRVTVLPRYFLFWSQLNEKIRTTKIENDWIIRVVFKNVPHWSKFTRETYDLFKKESIKLAFEKSEYQIDEKNRENLLILKFQ